MQRLTPTISYLSPNPVGRRTRRGVLAALLLGLGGTTALVGCGGAADGPGPAGAPGKPYDGMALTVRCPDVRLAGILAPMAKAWAARTGAKVEVTASPMTPGDAADVGVLPFAELGAWAERGELAPVPAALKETAHPYQWSAVLAVYRGEPYAGWGGQLFGLPLAGDGHVLVYRADRLADPAAAAEYQTQTGRPLAVPETWEDLADVAAFFARRDGRPSLPPLPADPAGLTDRFFRVAAGFDRAAQSEITSGQAPGKGGDVPTDPLAFPFRLDTGRPRIDAPAFATAAGWLADLKPRGCVPADGPADPAAALTEGRAVLAVLALDEVARLRGGRAQVDPRLGVAPPPGTRGYIDPATGKLVPVAGNYVPYFAGGWLGVVRKRCPNPDAAFDLLADLGGPARSLEVIAATGYGPFRDSHLDRDRLLVWYGYGFDDERSRALQDAVRGYVGKAVRNPTYGLRGPDHATLTAVLGEDLKRIAAGEVPPADGLKRAVAGWEKATADVPPEKLREWRRRAVGLH